MVPGRRSFAVGAAVLGWASPALAGTLNAGGLPLGADALEVAPSLALGREGQEAALELAAGLGDRVDLAVGVAGVLATGTGAGEVAVMSRVFVLPGVGLALGAAMSTDGGPLVWEPAVHTAWEGAVVALGVDVGVDMAGLEGWAVVAPEARVHERVGIFLEVDPVVDIASRAASWTVVPGVDVAVGPPETHALTLGVALPIGSVAEVELGLAWTASFGVREPDLEIAVQPDAEGPMTVAVAENTAMTSGTGEEGSP